MKTKHAPTAARVPALRFPEFQDAGAWKESSLTKYADIYQPTTISQKNFTETGFPVYGANGIVGFYDKFNHDTWQTIVTCRGSTCGTVNRTNGKSWITGNAMVVNFDRNNIINKDFGYYSICGMNFSSIIAGSGIPQITRDSLLNLVIAFPGLIEQQRIADCLSSLDEQIETQTAKLEALRQHKQGLLQNLFPRT